MSQTSSQRRYTGREIGRLDAARKGFRDATGPHWMHDTQPKITAVEITEGGVVYRYTRLDDPGHGGLVETVVGEAR